MVSKPDKLRILQDRAAQARNLELLIADLSGQIKIHAEALRVLYHSVLPDLLNEVGLDRIGVPPDGNKPGVDYILKPNYVASIAASWPLEKKQDAFAVLKRYKAEDLIKTKVEARLPKGNLTVAKRLFKQIKGLKVEGAAISLDQSVHASTLTAWLREVYESGKTLPAADLEKIGGYVGQYVKAADRKE